MTEAMDVPMSCNDDFIVFGAPCFGPEEVEEVLACLACGWIGTGPRARRLEDDFRAYIGHGHAVAVNSCTAALHLALLVAGIGPGDEVIAPAMTFCATINAIIHTGATPVIADVDPRTMNLDYESVTARLNPRTRALLPVHFAGRPCSMGPLRALAADRGLLIFEDCAHAVEAADSTGKTGTLGDFGCFSFYANKNMTTGEGGMVIARRKRDADRIRRLALHGLSNDAWRRFAGGGYHHYDVAEPGFKCNMTDLQASLGIHQLAKIEKNWTRRQAIWQRYQEAFDGLPVTLPAKPDPRTRHAYHLFTLLIDERRTGMSRDAFLLALTARRIGTGVHYRSVTEFRCYRRMYGWRGSDAPVARRIGRQTVSLPLYAGMQDDDVERVVAAVHEVLAAS